MSWLSEFPPEILGNIFSFLSLLELECTIACGSTVLNRKLSSGYIDRLVAPRELLYESLPFAKVGFLHYSAEDCRNCLVGPLKSFKNVQSIVFRKFRHTTDWCLSLMSAEYFSLVRLDLSVCAHSFQLLPELCARRILLCRTMPSLEHLLIDILGTHHYQRVELAMQYLFGTLPQSLRSLCIEGEGGARYSLRSLVVELPPQLEVLQFILPVSNWPLCPAQTYGPLIEKLKDIQREVNIGPHLRILPEEVLNRQISLFSILPASLTSMAVFGGLKDGSTIKLDEFPPEIRTLELVGNLSTILRLNSLTSLTGNNIEWTNSTLPSLTKYIGHNLPSNLLPQLRELKHTSSSFLPAEIITSATNLTSLSIERTSLILHGNDNQETRAIFGLRNLTSLSAYCAELDISCTILEFPPKLKKLKLESQSYVARRFLSLLPPSLEHLGIMMIERMQWDAMNELTRLRNLNTLILAAHPDRRSYDSFDVPDVFWTQDLVDALPKSLTRLELDYSFEISSSYPLTIPLPLLTSLSLHYAVVDIQSYVLFPSTLTKLWVYSIIIHEVDHLPLLNQLALKLPKVALDRPRVGISSKMMPDLEKEYQRSSLFQQLTAKPEFAPFYHILHHMWKDLYLYSKQNPILKPLGFLLCSE